MTSARTGLVLCLSTCFVFTAAISSAATPQASIDGQAPGAAAPSATIAQAAQEEDDAILQPAEPEYRLINLPTTMLLPKYRMSFDLTHRFEGNLAVGSFLDNLKTLFGIDQGATIGLEFRIAVARRVQAAVYRTSSDRTIQFHGKWDAVRQSGPSPVSASALLSIEGTDNFTDDSRSPALGAAVSYLVGETAGLYATPIWVHNVAPGLGVTRDTFFVGVGTRVRIRPTVYVTAEVSPRLAGYQPGPPVYGFAIEKRAGGHMFQLNFTNTSSTTYAQVAKGGFTDSLFMGFNLARKFF